MSPYKGEMPKRTAKRGASLSAPLSLSVRRKRKRSESSSTKALVKAGKSHGKGGTNAGLAFSSSSIKRVVYSVDLIKNGTVSSNKRIGRLSKESLAILSSCAEQFVCALSKTVAKSARDAKITKVRVLDVEKATQMDSRFDFLQTLFSENDDNMSGSASLVYKTVASASSTGKGGEVNAVTLNDSALNFASNSVDSPVESSVRGVEVDESVQVVQHNKTLKHECAEYEDY